MNALLATRTGALEAARLRLFALGVPAARSFGNAAFSTFDNQPLGGMKGFSEKERAVENAFFSKEDEKLLRKLLSKVKTVTDETDKNGAAGVEAKERSSLQVGR
mmetsp:Transcript_14345/g.33967  ORF Transcript_14345/g.33967 Transcript_14345/m.33967 type:complete len:104 (-) Transcript_14345:376-687(-)